MSIRVTLSDSTRAQIAVEDIESVEQHGRGALVYLHSGQTLSVAQDAKTVELRIEAALAQEARKMAPSPEPVRERAPQKATSRIKRYLTGRASFSALMIANAWRV